MAPVVLKAAVELGHLRGRQRLLLRFSGDAIPKLLHVQDALGACHLVERRVHDESVAAPDPVGGGVSPPGEFRAQLRSSPGANDRRTGGAASASPELRRLETGLRAGRLPPEFTLAAKSRSWPDLVIDR